MKYLTLAQWLETPQGILLDVREPDEFLNHHLPQAHNLPLSQLAIKLSNLDSTQAYTLICHSGKRAQRAAEVLQSEGFSQLTVITDGMASANRDDTITDLQAAIATFNHDRHWGAAHSPRNLATSISIEAAELLENFQWTDEAKDMANVREELADVLIYSLNLASRLDLDVATIVRDKLIKNAIKYPLPDEEDKR